MLPTLAGLDHLVVAVRDLDAAAAEWAALGFTLSPRGLHSAHVGSANHTMMFGEDCLELPGVVTPTPHNQALRDFVAAREGLDRAAFTTTDAAAAAQIGEMWRVHLGLDAREAERRALAALREVNLPDPEGALRAFPHELSGGQRQRVMIAMALALEPEVLICDEPTTAVMFITHDFGVVAEIADRVAVMRLGRVVEEGSARWVLTNPRHDYTRALLAAVPGMHAPAPRLLSADAVLQVRGLTKTYVSRGLFRRRKPVRALAAVSVTLKRGATLAAVGESGSGKSTLARCVVGLLGSVGGQVVIGDAPARRSRRGRSLPARRRRAPRGKRATCSRLWGWTPTRWTATRMNSPAASASASASPARRR